MNAGSNYESCSYKIWLFAGITVHTKDLDVLKACSTRLKYDSKNLQDTVNPQGRFTKRFRRKLYGSKLVKTNSC